MELARLGPLLDVAPSFCAGKFEHACRKARTPDPAQDKASERGLTPVKPPNPAARLLLVYKMNALQAHALKPDSKIRINKVEVLLNTVLGMPSAAPAARCSRLSR